MSEQLPQPESPPRNILFRVIGGILMAAGVLLVAGAGLCFLWFIGGGAMRYLGLVLLLSALPMVYGGILLWSGRVISRSSGGVQPIGLLVGVLLLGVLFFYLFMHSGPFGPS